MKLIETIVQNLNLNGLTYPVVDDYLDIKNALNEGKTIAHWEEGKSLDPIIKDREYCLISPINSLDDVKIGDCVFCKVRGFYMVHRVIDIIERPTQGKWFKIGDTWNTIFGWTQDVFGIATPTDCFQGY